MVFQYICWVVITVANVVAAHSIRQFALVAIPELRAIRRATDVVKHDILRGVVEKRRAEDGGKAPN